MANRNRFFLGLVLNPKTLCPSLAFKEQRRTVTFYMENLREGGKGYFQGPERDAYRVAEESGFPRGHTPDGVKVQKAGYGTVLYTSLCLAATMEAKKLLDLDTNLAEEGVCSNEHRSRAADIWWANAKERNLAYEASFTVEGEEEEEIEDFDVDFDSYRRNSKLFDAAKEALAEGNDVYGSIRTISVRGEQTITTGGGDVDGTADVYPWERGYEGCVGGEILVPYYGVTACHARPGRRCPAGKSERL